MCFLLFGQELFGEQRVSFLPDTATIACERNLIQKTLITKEDMTLAVGKHKVHKVRIVNAVIDESAVKYLATLNAKELILVDVNLDDGNAALIISSSPGLEIINLSGTDVTDSIVTLLLRAENIKDIILYNTAISPQGFKRLRKNRPDIRVQALPLKD
jgi:hypothetical protein